MSKARDNQRAAIRAAVHSIKKHEQLDTKLMAIAQRQITTGLTTNYDQFYQPKKRRPVSVK
ncbi:MAG: hypothetical protein K2Y14_03960 [Burkholderiales bacterium]|nr:hypothetical protein [Burkholderiales bacterium]